MYERILVLLNEESTFRAAACEAVALGKVHGSELLFLSILPAYTLPVPDMPISAVPLPDEFQNAARKNAEQMLAEAEAKADKAGVRHRREMVEGPEDAQTVVDFARRRDCRLIVVGSAGRNAVVRLLSGSVIPGLITLSPLPVLICRGPMTQMPPDPAG
jgi:nucleotide-binding universal stress UspA family protein